MVSAIDKAKRALVIIIRALATAYNCCVTVTRESGDADITKAYKKLSLKVHPDRGGSVQDQQRLNTAHDAECGIPHTSSGSQMADLVEGWPGSGPQLNRSSCSRAETGLEN